MENPCFISEVGDTGDLRRCHSLPPSKNATTISAIYRPEDYSSVNSPSIDNRRNLRRTFTSVEQGPTFHKDCPGAWRLEFLPSSRPQTTLLSAILLATFITLAATAALLYLRRAVNTRYPPPVPDPWAGEMVVSGEFRVTNEPYRSSLENLTSPDFQQLAWRIGKQLELLFKESLMSEHFKAANVIKLTPDLTVTPGLTVHCRLILHPTDMGTASKVGLAFLGGLKHLHGHLWLGQYSIDVRSIGFQATSEEVTWSAWSGWSECTPPSEAEGGLRVRTRKRVCLSLINRNVNRVTPCLIGRSQEINDTETEICPEPETSTPLSTSPSTSTEASTEPRLEESNASASTLPTWAPLEETRRNCNECKTEEVCVALGGDLTPFCRPAVDLSDPLGCGGLCTIAKEICYRLQPHAFRCIDQSNCLESDWQCQNRVCVPIAKRCDGHFNCYDRSDEVDCECDLKTHFRCGLNYSCHHKSRMCDGIVDCWDATDEANCTIACLGSDQFTCNDSQCINRKNFCDGYPDCKDGSDEPSGCEGDCKDHEWRCMNRRCIPRREVCNGLDDCSDNSDEMKCGKRKILTQ